MIDFQEKVEMKCEEDILKFQKQLELSFNQFKNNKPSYKVDEYYKKLSNYYFEQLLSVIEIELTVSDIKKTNLTYSKNLSFYLVEDELNKIIQNSFEKRGLEHLHERGQGIYKIELGKTSKSIFGKPFFEIWILNEPNDINKNDKLKFKPELMESGIYDFTLVQTKDIKYKIIGSSNNSNSTQSNSNCFIVTATLGDNNHPIVKDYKFFRDNWLDNRTWGKSFINWYYVNSPILAKFISQSIFLQRLTFILIVKPFHFIIKVISENNRKKN